MSYIFVFSRISAQHSIAQYSKKWNNSSSNESHVSFEENIKRWNLSPSLEVDENQAVLLSDDEEFCSVTRPVVGGISPLFVPLAERAKYEKLTLNTDDLSSDDSIINADGRLDTGSGKLRHRLKKNVVYNIPEKLQSVYNRVDKSAIPVVRHLVERTSASHSKKLDSTSRVQKSIGDHGIEVDSDDSIGSASDLTAVDDAPKKTVIGFFTKHEDADETISQSNKTCGSSAYHAECESVTTNEDDAVSRCVVRKCKTRRQRQVKNTVPADISTIEENPNHFTGYEYGNEPLLLDDSEEECDENTKGTMEWPNATFSVTNEKLPALELTDIVHHSEQTVASDVFALAPFEKPSKVKQQAIQPVPTNLNNNIFVNVNENNVLGFQEEKDQDLSAHLFAVIDKNKETLSASGVNTDFNAIEVDSNDSLYDAFLPTALDNNYSATLPQSSFKKYNEPLAKIPSESDLHNQESFSQVKNSSDTCDLFGSKPFCDNVANDYINSMPAMQNSSATCSKVQNDMNHLNSNENKRTTSANTSMFFNEPDENKETPFESHTYEDVSVTKIFPLSVNRYSDMSLQIHNMPIVCLKLDNNETTGKEHESLQSRVKELLSDKPRQFLKNEECGSDISDKSNKHKKEKKSKSKYHHLLDKKSDKDDVPFHAKFEQKLAKGGLGYKKVSSKNKKSNEKSSTQAGFSNMSFEDIPQDPDMDF